MSPSAVADPGNLAPITPPADDRTLIEAAQAGDRRALDALLRRHQDRIYAICRRMAGNDADALDATQEALIAITRGIAKFDHRSAFTTWTYRVATNACLDELRRRNRRPIIGLEPHTAEIARAESDSSPDLADTMVDRSLLDEALADLPPEFRAPVVLRDQLGMDYAEIAEVLEIPPGTVRSRIARGRAALARSLGGNQSTTAERPTSSHD